jgi:hypothetical protein
MVLLLKADFIIRSFVWVSVVDAYRRLSWKDDGEDGESWEGGRFCDDAAACSH